MLKSFWKLESIVKKSSFSNLRIEELLNLEAVKEASPACGAVGNAVRPALSLAATAGVPKAGPHRLGVVLKV